MMHQGMDFSKLKKVASDKKTSTLRHPSGHEIRIAHAGMSPKMREQVEAMPVHLAEGGEAEAPDDDEEEVEKVAGPIEEEGEQAEDEAEPVSAPAAPASPVAPATPAAPAVRAAPDPDANTIVVQGKRPPTVQELDNEDALFAQDVQRGHIKPETMQSLYDKKDTLGKIGTLFGLLVSGAGSGLAGQPNAVMEMMKNEINNDLEAQKASNSNAQNWLRLSQAHEMQKAQIHQMDLQNKLTAGQTSKIPYETEQLEAHTENLKADTDIKATAAAKNKMLLSATAHMLGMTNKLPDGPTKQNALNTLNTQIEPAVQGEIKKNNKLAADQLGARSKLRGEQHPPGPALVDTGKILQMSKQANFLQGQGMQGMSVITPEQSTAALHEASIVNKNRLVYDNWKNSFEKLDKMAAAGRLNPDNYKTIKTHLAAQLVGSMPQAEAENLANSLLPDWKDWGATRETKAKQAYEQFKVQESATPILAGVPGLMPPFPAPPQLQKAKTGHSGEAMAAPAKAETKDGARSRSKSGKPMTYKGGKWTYDK